MSLKIFPIPFWLLLLSQLSLAAPLCREQAPQDFLIRANELKTPKSEGGYVTALARAVRYRTERYGAIPGLTDARVNKTTVVSQVGPTTFLGVKVQLHRRVIPALKCVEEKLATECAAEPAYVPRHVSTLRTRNTYRGGEISNHMFGIAIDIDPDLNPCCGCVAPWSENWKCKRRIKSVFDRVEFPKCWVGVFERYGFYWLGWDQMQDTMHFEFLGDPSRITE